MTAADRVTQTEARYEYAAVKQKREVRGRDHCITCGDRVPAVDYSYKFAAAGGLLAGPFCSRGCYWTFITDNGGSE